MKNCIFRAAFVTAVLLTASLGVEAQSIKTSEKKVDAVTSATTPQTAKTTSVTKSPKKVKKINTVSPSVKQKKQKAIQADSTRVPRCKAIHKVDVATSKEAKVESKQAIKGEKIAPKTTVQQVEK